MKKVQAATTAIAPTTSLGRCQPTTSVPRPAATVHAAPSGASTARARPLASTSATIALAARVVCPEGKEFGVMSIPGPSASRVTSTCLITWVERFAPSTSEPSGSSSPGRRRSSTSSTARASITATTGTLTVSTASSAYCASGPSCSPAPERIS